MGQQRLFNDLPDRHAWIHRAPRILKDRLHMSAPVIFAGFRRADVFAHNQDIAVIGFFQSQQQAEKRTFARAVAAHDGKTFPTVQAQAYIP